MLRREVRLRKCVQVLGLTLLVGTFICEAASADFIEVDRLVPDENQYFYSFGEYVDVEGDRLIVDGYSDSRGSVYVFERNPLNEWEEVAELKPPPAFGDILLGNGLSLEGGRIAAGSLAGDYSEGGVLVFDRRLGTDEWELLRTVRPRDLEPNSGFQNCAMQEETLVVGASGDSEVFTFSGAAYVFQSSGPLAEWGLAQKLKASDPATLSFFGSSVALDGDTLVAGAPLLDVEGQTWAGAAYVFHRDASSTWEQAAKLVASTVSELGEFGLTLDLEGDLLVVGAPGDSTDDYLRGAAFLFERDRFGDWIEIQRLTASDGARLDQYGAAVVIENDMIVVTTETGNTEGRAYVYQRDPEGVWKELQILRPSIEAGTYGDSVDLDGQILVVGASSGNLGDGSVFVYEWTN